MKLVMTLLVRDEEDILTLNLEHHLAQGVDHFVVTDNGSQDRTLEILSAYVDRGLLDLIHEPSETYEQSAWVTRMASHAADIGADWVIHADADEFWVAQQPGITVRDVLEVLPDDDPVWIVQRWNAALHRKDDCGDWIDPATVAWFDPASKNNLGRPLPPKVLHRGCRDVLIAQGNHSLTWPDSTVRAQENRDLVILHFPYRGYPHYSKKIQQGGRSYSSNPDLPYATGSTWRIDYLNWMAGTLRQQCRERLPDHHEFENIRKKGCLRPAPNPLPSETQKVLATVTKKSFVADEGVICLADDNYFFGVRMLYHSLRQKRHLTVYDLGLGDQAHQWVAHHSGIEIRSIPESPLIEAIRLGCGERTMAKATKREWPLWICPELILDAPYRRVAWIDADAIVLRGLNRLFRRIGRAPFITGENLAPDQTANPASLLTLLPLAGGREPASILLNAGVSGWCLERDSALLEGYTYPIRCIFLARTLAHDAVRWHDQGCLIWALQNAGYDESILQPMRWNLCVKYSALAGLSIDSESQDSDIIAWLDRARELESDAKIVHWNGHPVPWM